MLLAAAKVDGVARVNEVRLKREATEGKIIDFWRTEQGFEFIRADAISSKENKVCVCVPLYTVCVCYSTWFSLPSPQGKHCLLPGSIQALQSLKSIAPPITVFIKANTEESIT